MEITSPPITSCDLHRPRAALMFVGESCPLCEVIEVLVGLGVKLPETDEAVAAVEGALIDFMYWDEE